MREINYAAMDAEVDDIFNWMIFHNGGLWLLTKDFFASKRVGWYNHLLTE